MASISRIPRFAAAALLALASACVMQPPKDAMRLLPNALERRAEQSRNFSGVAEGQMLAAGSAVLQDLGFTIDEGETALGLIVASKERTAVDEAAVAAAYLVSILSVLAMVPSEPEYEQRQQVRVALVTSPASTGDAPATSVRVTLQRVVYDNHERITRVERVDDPELYQEFFDRLSQSLYLESQAP